MKRLLLLVLFCVSSNTFAAYYHLKFSNDWEINFDAPISSATPFGHSSYSFTSFGDVNFQGSAPTLNSFTNSLNNGYLFQLFSPSFIQNNHGYSKISFVDGSFDDFYNNYNFNILYSSNTQVFSTIAEQLEWLQGEVDFFTYLHLSSNRSFLGRTTLIDWQISSRAPNAANNLNNKVYEPASFWLTISGLLGLIGFTNRKITCHST